MTPSISLTSLIVESDPLIRAYIIERMHKHAIVCLEADNGMTALEQLEKNPVDFVICNAHMKKMDGIQFIVIAQRSHRDIPVVVTMMTNNEEIVINAFRAGAVNVIKIFNNLNELEDIVLPLTDLIEKRKSRIFDFKSVRYVTEELRIANDPSMIPMTVDYLLGFLSQSRFAKRLTGLEVALYEMIANAIEHGNLAITNTEKEKALSENRYTELLAERRNNPSYQNRLVKIKLNYNPKQLTISITDEGNGFNIEDLTSNDEENLLAQSGRGILLSRMYCDEILFNRKGNEVTLILKTDSEANREGIIYRQHHDHLKAHILVVDNNLQILRYISALLKEVGYSYGYIAHSDHLFPRLQEETFDLILLDVNMPKTDGLSLLKELKAHTLFRRIPVIMLTSDKDDRLMAECFSSGAEDFIVKPVNKITLQSRISSTLNQQESFKQLGKANEKLELLNVQLQEQYDVLTKTQKELHARHQQIEDDISLAQRIQRKILSTEQDLSFVKTAIVFNPHSVVSGDFHYQETDKSGNLNLFLGDATGHGVSAAFITMMVRMALGMTDSSLQPDQIIRNLNKQLAECIPRGDHLTGIMLKISPDGWLTGCNAGGPPIYVVSNQQTAKPMFVNGGQALGMFADERIPYQLESIQLTSGDKIIMFTDGIYEWRNQQNVSFGLESASQYILENQHENALRIINGLKEAVMRFASHEPQADDVTLIGVEFK